MKEDKLYIYYKGVLITTFNQDEPIKSLVDYLHYITEDQMKDIEFKTSEKDSTTEISESVKEDVPGKEYTIWSSSDLAESGDQIPLVKLKVNDSGDLDVITQDGKVFTRGNNKEENKAQDVEDAKVYGKFNVETYNTALNSLKWTKGKSIKDRLLRIDKSLNHNDPNLSTELIRQNIRANRGTEKRSIKDILGKDFDPTDPSLDVVPQEGDTSVEAKAKQSAKKAHYHGIQALANQILLSNRDELKAAANTKTATEESLVEMFKDFTGVDYYTEKLVDEEQYNYLLDLLGRSSDKYDETYVSPDENDYIKSLKNLTEDLIEKVNLKQNPNFYKASYTPTTLVENRNKLQEVADKTDSTEDDLVGSFGDLTGVDYYTEQVINMDKYKEIIKQLGLDKVVNPSENKYIQKLKDFTENLIEKVLLRNDPDFYKL